MPFSHAFRYSLNCGLFKKKEGKCSSELKTIPVEKILYEVIPVLTDGLKQILGNVE